MSEPSEPTRRDGPVSKVSKKIEEVISDIKKEVPELEPAIDFYQRGSSIVTSDVVAEVKKEVPEMLASSKRL